MMNHRNLGGGGDHKDSSLTGWTPPNMERSMSVAAPLLAQQMRDKVVEGVQTKGKGSTATFMNPVLTAANHTFVLPPLNDFSASIRTHLYGKLLDIQRLDQLQRKMAINSHPWQERAILEPKPGSTELQFHSILPPRGTETVLSALLPINVMGDGNCCLHAVSIALWGIQDRIGVLRGALSGMLKSKEMFFQKRWRVQEMQWDAEDAKQMGHSVIDRSEEEWNKEWIDLMSRSERDGAYLAQIHLFVLAHVIRRPIIVYAHTEQDDSPCRFRGIYLPLEWPVEYLEKTPILLGYQGSHFIPLVYHLQAWPPQAHEDWPLIPLEVNGTLLRVLFAAGRPTRVTYDANGIDNCTDTQLIEARLPFVKIDEDSYAVRMDLRRACVDARSRLKEDIPDLISSNVGVMIKTFLEQARKEALEMMENKRVPLTRSDSELAKELQKQEDWEAQLALSNRLGSFKLSPSSPLPPPSQQSKATTPAAVLLPPRKTTSAGQLPRQSVAGAASPVSPPTYPRTSKAAPPLKGTKGYTWG